MKVEKPYSNWTMFPNCILDNIEKYTHPEFKVLSYMVRRNLGFKNEITEFSLDFIMNHTGLARATVVRAIEGPIQVDVRTLLFVFLPVYLVVFVILTIPIALLMILFNKISRSTTYDLGIFTTGEGFDTVKLLR